MKKRNRILTVALSVLLAALVAATLIVNIAGPSRPSPARHLHIMKH